MRRYTDVKYEIAPPLRNHYLISRPIMEIMVLGIMVTCPQRSHDDPFNARVLVNPCDAACFISIFHHLKLKLLTQFSALNDEKYFYLI